MSFFKDAVNVGKSIIHQAEDTIANPLAPVERAIGLPPIANPIRRRGRSRRRRVPLPIGEPIAQITPPINTVEELFNTKSEGFDSFGQQLKEAVFPGSTDTPAGRKAESGIKSAEDFVQSEKFKKVAKIAAKLLEEVGIASGQPELVAAGGALDTGLALTDDVKEASAALNEAVIEKDFSKLITAVGKGNKIAQDLLERQGIEDENFNKFSRNLEIVEQAQSGELDDILKAVKGLAQENFQADVRAEQANETIESELRNIEREEEREAADIEDLVRTVRPPQTASDMIEEIVRINDAGDLTRFINDNISLFEGFTAEEQNRVLDAALDSGLFVGVLN